MSDAARPAVLRLGNRMISSLHSPPFRLFFCASVGQSAALTVQTMVSPLLMYRLTGSSALMGVNSLVGAIPGLLIGTFGGALADRIPKKHILIACFIMAALIATTLGTLLRTGILSSQNEGSWMILLALNFLQGGVMGFMMPSMMSIVPETVKRDQLMNAIALINLQISILSFIIPSAAGIMIDKYGFESTYYSIAVFYVIAVITILFLPRDNRVKTQSGPILENITVGFKYIIRHRTILYIQVITLAMVLLSVPHQFMLPLFTDGIFKVGATGLGLLVSLSGAGGMAGSLALTLLPNRKRGLILLLAGLVAGISLVCFAFSPVWKLSLGIIVFTGLASAVRGNLTNALLQAYSDAVYMGRVMSLTYIQFGMMSVCTFLVGLIAEKIAVQWVIGSMAGLLTLIMIGVLIGNRQIRELD